MNKKNKINHILDRMNFKLNYIIANTIMKKNVDKKNNYFNIMDDIELVTAIVDEGKSFSRFGDGELSLILNDKFDLNFQLNSEKLNIRLKEVLNSDIDKLIIGISRSLNNPSIYNNKVQRYYRTFNYLYRENCKKIIPNNKVFGNSLITRFYIDYDVTDLDSAYARINNLKRIWNGKKILICEGKKTKLGVGNDLFKNTISIRRILTPEINAFDKYNEILECIKKNVKDDEIVLLALGPTATVLTYDLVKENIQTIDVGHIDIEYEWLLMKASKRVAIKGKFVNEIKGEKYIENYEVDEDYNNSIIERI